MPKNTSKDYKIPPLDPLLRLHATNPKVFKNKPAEWINEFFLIEALLRTEEVKKAYRRGKNRALMAILQDHGIIEQDPLRGTHHALLVASSEDSKANAQWAELGYVDKKLQIRDLGVVAKRPANTTSLISGVDWYWGESGEQECLRLLRHPHPRYLFLQIDAARKPQPIINRLRPLLKERHELLKQMARSQLFAFHHRLQKTPFNDIPAWLRYFQCYDLRHDQGLEYGPIALRMYGTHKKRDNPEKAVARVEWAIEGAKDKNWPPPVSKRP
jgi:hypothetical protein